MENKNQPAFPIPVAGNETGVYTLFNANNGDDLGGLTKLEKIAAMALQGILAKSHAIDGMTEHEVKSITADAIMFADELLTQLEGQQP